MASSDRSHILGSALRDLIEGLPLSLEPLGELEESEVVFLLRACRLSSRLPEARKVADRLATPVPDLLLLDLEDEVTAFALHALAADLEVAVAELCAMGVSDGEMRSALEKGCRLLGWPTSEARQVILALLSEVTEGDLGPYYLKSLAFLEETLGPIQVGGEKIDLAAALAAIPPTGSPDPRERVRSALEEMRKRGISVEEEAFDFLRAAICTGCDPLLSLLGPVNPAYGAEPDPGNPCSLYGGCRMLTCTEFEEEEEWFTGECSICLVNLVASFHALRLPLRGGGWRGCFCSWEHVALTTEDPVELFLIGRFKGMLEETKIRDRR